MIVSADNINDHLKRKRIYINIEENGGKPHKYIYVLIITTWGKKENGTKILLW